MTEELREWVASRSWYHTMEIAPGVLTPGWFDLRSFAGEIPWGDLTGMRCLDVGTFDGFWAFEMERRGGAVVAVDELDPDKWDWPAGSRAEAVAAIADRHRRGESFPRLKELLGSGVERHHCNVYDLDADRLGGPFDVIYVGSILLHLRDPVRALERVRAVAKPSARVFVVDAIDIELTLAFPSRPMAGLDGLGRPWWWKPNLAGLARMVTSAGFTVDRPPRRVFLQPGAGQPTPWPRPGHALRRDGREMAVFRLKGDPHGLVVARP
ncbi:MAG: hypothetical protein JWO37_3400 [Acidimicrobiales bacterium]|jgi:tRNA (mo5U34)-methyltransferase|nr:hypothetical protein [Acidimicrobiales bacterium]